MRPNSVSLTTSVDRSSDLTYLRGGTLCGQACLKPRCSRRELHSKREPDLLPKRRVLTARCTAAPRGPDILRYLPFSVAIFRSLICLRMPFGILTGRFLHFCSITAVGAVITRNRQLRNVNTDAVKSHVGCGRSDSSIGLEQGHKCATERKGKETSVTVKRQTKTEKRGTAKWQPPVDSVTSQGEWGNPESCSEHPRVPTCAPRFGR